VEDIISDVVLLKELPKALRESEQAYIGCIGGAIMKEKYLDLIKNAGFQDVKVIEEASFPINLGSMISLQTL